jgi:hypothetical protein
LFVVSISGVFLYKTNSSSSTVSLIKSYQINASDYSFEDTQGILAVTTPQGKVFCYDLYQKNGSRYYQISTFDLIFDLNGARQVSSGSKSGNLLTYASRLDLNQVKLGKIYNNLFLIHLDNLAGKLYLFSLENPQLPSLYCAYNIQRGIHSVGISENLLIVLNYNTQETLIFDIQNHPNDYLCKICHLEHLSSTLPYTFTPFQLTSKTFLVDNNIIADLDSDSLNLIDLNPSVLIENHPDDIKSIKFLLRRVNCKIKVLDRIKQSIMQLLPIKKLEVVFETLARSYHLVQDSNEYEINSKKQSENSEHLEEGNLEVNINVETKNELGLTVLLQSDLYFSVFAPAYKEIKDFKYLAEVIYLFMHYLIQYSVDVHLSIQYLLFKIFVKNNEFLRIQKLVEIKFFNDSQDIALLLTSLGKTEKIQSFPNCYNLGIDMLNRLKLFDVVAQELLDQSFYYETLDLLKNKNINNQYLKSEASIKCGFDNTAETNI